MPPLVSLVLAVKNGMPYLRRAIEAVRQQTFTDYEVVVQDGGSTDGTLEYLQSAGIERLNLRSEPDSGVGQAYNRAVSRATGDFVCILSADEFLEPDAIERGVRLFERYPEAVFVNGAVRLVAGEDKVLQVFESPQFDLLRHLSCEVVLAFAGLLNKRKIGSDFRFDEGLKTCPDYDFWIRLGARFPPDEFVMFREVFKSARADRASMSFRAESYEQFCADKLLALDRFLSSQPQSPLTAAIARSAKAGIYVWAAESLHRLDANSTAYLRCCEDAAAFDPGSPRLAQFGRRTSAFSIDPTTRQFVRGPRPQTDRPLTTAGVLPGAINLKTARIPAEWNEATATFGEDSLDVVTAPRPWNYAVAIPWICPGAMDTIWYWARIELEVLSGQIGVGMLIDTDILHEKLVGPANGRTVVYVRMSSPEAIGVVIRNAGMPQRSHLRVFSAVIEAAERD